jgi:hypothetical protein
MWADGATGVNVGVDQRSQHPWAFESRFEVETNFTQEREIGPQSGGNDNFIDNNGSILAVILAYHSKTAVRLPHDLVNRERCDNLEYARFHQTLQPLPQGSSGR